MSFEPHDPHSIDAARQRYAYVIGWGTRIGMLAMTLAFIAYCAGWLKPMVPLESLPGLWGQPVAVYLKRSGLPTGWGWLQYVMQGDIANLVGIAVLAGTSLMGLLGLIPLYARGRDRVYLLIVGAGCAVMALAASSVLGH